MCIRFVPVLSWWEPGEEAQLFSEMRSWLQTAFKMVACCERITIQFPYINVFLINHKAKAKLYQITDEEMQRIPAHDVGVEY